jgi:hypothetical protein
MAVAVAWADFAIAAMHQKFDLFSPSADTPLFDRFGLRVVYRWCALAAFDLHRPFAVVRHYVLVLTRHPIISLCRPRTRRNGDLIRNGVNAPHQRLGLDFGLGAALTSAFRLCVKPHVLPALWRPGTKPLALYAIAGVRPTLDDMGVFARFAREVAGKAEGLGLLPGYDFGHWLFYQNGD